MTLNVRAAILFNSYSLDVSIMCLRCKIVDLLLQTDKSITKLLFYKVNICLVNAFAYNYIDNADILKNNFTVKIDSNLDLQKKRKKNNARYY